MDKKLEKAFNEQIKNELYSAYLYLAMAAYCESKNLAGFAHWLKVQAKEEQSHAMKLFDFLIDRGVRVVLQAIAQPPLDFSSAADVFEKTLEHEKKVTALIDKLYMLSRELKDNPAAIFLQWFVSEQVEEEKNAAQILDTIKVIKPDSAALIMLDRELAKREG
ncbi:MAG: ferritin [Candidatus Omnitrophica bacterium]|nr:ferritin [Candidatus Omnitrophota bacterium]